MTTARRSSRRAVSRMPASSAICSRASCRRARVRAEARGSGWQRGEEIDRLIHLLAKLPGLGPRSARRAALALLKKRESLLEPLASAMAEAAAALKQCSNCGNLDTRDPCALCRDEGRDASTIC